MVPPGLHNPQEFVSGLLVVGSKHDAQAGHDDVELGVSEGQGLRVGLLPGQADSAVGCLTTAGFEELRGEIAGHHLCAHHRRGNGRVA